MYMHRILQFTHALFLLPVLYFYFYCDKNIPETILAYMLIITMIFSQLFWYNPIKGSTIHKCDAIIAKIVILSFAVYTFWKYGFMLSYTVILMCIATSFYYSNHYSRIEWCGAQHIQSHCCLHFFCYIATLYVFSNKYLKTILSYNKNEQMSESWNKNSRKQ